jgi:hypothetical protein
MRSFPWSVKSGPHSYAAARSVVVGRPSFSRVPPERFANHLDARRRMLSELVLELSWRDLRMAEEVIRSGSHVKRLIW